MKYAYEDLGDNQFEDLIIFLCQHLLGISVQGFSEGPDGGRDGKFVGTAQLHPSTASPWVGTTIIQAKHTNGYNRNFMESDFYSAQSKNTVLGQEIPRIKKLLQNKELDHYMLFSNRRLSAIGETTIRKHIAKECSIPKESIYLCGIEQLEIWLKKFPDLATLASLDPIDSPLIISPDDLSDIVEALATQKNNALRKFNDPPTPRVSFQAKNAINNMSKEYADLQRKRYLKETRQIQEFLATPDNAELLRKYEIVIDEFQFKIIARRKDYQTFDAVMEHLMDLLFGRDPILRQLRHKRLTRAILFYMYWNCDIGENA